MQGTQDQEDEIDTLLSEDAVNGEKEIFNATKRVVGYSVFTRLQWHSRHEIGEVPDKEHFEKWKYNSDRIVDLRKDEDDYTFFDKQEDVWHWLPKYKRKPNESYVAPISYIKAVRHAFDGEIDVDPATHPFAQRYIQAKRYFYEEVNGLTMPWIGKVFLNPPFNDHETWLRKAMFEMREGRTTDLIVLVDFDKLSSKYYQEFLPDITSIYLIAGKVQWTDKPRGKGEKSVPRHGYIFLYYGNNVEQFKKGVRKFVPGMFANIDLTPVEDIEELEATKDLVLHVS